MARSAGIRVACAPHSADLEYFTGWTVRVSNDSDPAKDVTVIRICKP